MAKPRVFISSTFYDLRQVREDLERFIKDLGYDAVRNETGAIPYGKSESVDKYAYREVELCDIIVSIIGGRYGSDSHHDASRSVSQVELKTALDRGIQVFIFIEKSVLAEYSTYQLNKGNEAIKYRFVDNTNIYEFIESLNQLPRNNPIAPFETSRDIVEYLRVQWAGLFQRFLQEQQRLSDLKVLEEMKSVAGTLQQLVSFLTDERKNKDDAIKGILLNNHPAFRRFAAVTKTAYRVFFTNLVELEKWLTARSYKRIASEKMDPDSVLEWSQKQVEEYIALTHKIFEEDGRLKTITDEEWRDDWIQLRTIQPQSDESDEEGLLSNG